MIYPLLICLISFFIDGISSYYVDLSFAYISPFTTIYSIIAVVIIYQFFNNNNKYYLSCLIIGLMFDIVYTNTFILNMITFLIIGFIISKIFNVLANNTVNNIIVSCISIFIYYLFTNIILVLTGYINFNIELILKILSCSIIMTIIYSLILSITINYISKNTNIKLVK